MSNEFKKRIEAAMIKHHEKLLPNKPRARKRNDNPEARISLEIKNHLVALGWSVDIVESKAVFSASAQSYTHGKTRPGFSDICGNSPSGQAVYIEVKSKGRRSSIRPAQFDFLTEKIKTNAFAIVADSVEYVDRIYKAWLASPDKVSLLSNELPKLQPRHSSIHDEFNMD
jgi:hypothetical protein